MSVRRQPIQALVAQDGLRLLFLSLVVGAVVAAVLLPPQTSPRWLDLSARLTLGLATELLALSILREVVPKPPVGKHIVGKNGAYYRWLASSALADVALHPIVRFPFWTFHFTRVLYLKALGTDVAWGASFHEHVVLREPSLVTIAPGAQLEPGVIVEAALHGAGRVRIAPITIGGGCLVGAHAIIMPGATLGHDATVAPGAYLGEDVRVGVGAKIGDGARVEKGADLGSYTSVGSGAIVSEGVRVGDRARIAAGALVAPNTEIGEREIWEGSPARPVVSEA